MCWSTRGNAKWKSTKWNQWRQLNMQLAQSAKVFNLVGTARIKNQSELETVLPLNLWATATIKNQSELETVPPLNSWAPATMKNQSKQDALLPLNMIPPFSWLMDSNNITRVRHTNLGNADRLSIMCWSTCGKAKWLTKMRQATWGRLVVILARAVCNVGIFSGTSLRSRRLVPIF